MLWNHIFFLQETKNFVRGGLRPSNALQWPGEDAHRVRHQDLERLGQKIVQKDCLGDDLRPIKATSPSQIVPVP